MTASDGIELQKGAVTDIFMPLNHGYSENFREQLVGGFVYPCPREKHVGGGTSRRRHRQQVHRHEEILRSRPFLADSVKCVTELEECKFNPFPD